MSSRRQLCTCTGSRVSARKAAKGSLHVHVRNPRWVTAGSVERR